MITCPLCLEEVDSLCEYCGEKMCNLCLEATLYEEAWYDDALIQMEYDMYEEDLIPEEEN